MSDLAAARTQLTEELERLLAVLPSISELAVTDPARLAWIQWKRTLLGQVQLLELREREIHAEPYLWIELARDDAERAVFGIAESRDTPVDQR